MNDIDYPLDQKVIDHAVDQLQQNRNEAKRILKDALKDAGGNYDIIVFRNTREFKRIIKALEDLRICWYEIDRDLYVNRHEIEDL